MPKPFPLAAVVLLAATASAADPVPPTDKLGKAIDAVSVVGSAGAETPLFAGGDAKARVVVFLSFDCPVSNDYAPVLADLCRAYADRGVAVVGVVPSDDPPAEIAKRAAAFALPFPVVSDPKLVAVDALKATTTPEAFVLDGRNVLRYRGRVDNAYGARLRKNPAVTEHDLAAALDAVLAGRDVSTPATKAIGCPVANKTTSAKADAPVTFHRDVLPVLQAHCQSCHRPGAVAPFSLATYKQAVNWSADMVEYTATKKMPPWKPSAGGPFRNNRGMPEKDVAVLAKWVDGGCPEGDPKDAPPAAQFPDGWNLGEPDLVLTPEADMHVGASGGDLFRCFVLPTKLAEDKYIVAYEVKPGNPQVVHHALNFFDTTGKARALAAKEAARATPADRDRGPGYPVGMGIGFVPLPADAKPGLPPIGSFGGWAPGQLGTRFPDGAGFWLPKEADVVVQIHYHRTGKAEVDRPKIGLYFAKKPVAKGWQTITVGGMSPFSFIPADRPSYPVKGSAWLATDADLHSVMPHMHLIGRSAKVTLTPPGGTPRVLVDVPDWDYNWQETYWFAEPIRAVAGTRIDVEAVYDNSAGNPHNPNRPPKSVWFGEQTTNEMLFGFIGATPTGPGRVRVVRTEPKK